MNVLRPVLRITIIAAALLTLTTALHAQSPVKFAAEVPLLDCGSGIPCIEARIGDSKLLRLGIDSGDDPTVIDKDVAEAAGLKSTKPMPAGAPAGMFITQIPAIHIGGVTLRDANALGMSLTEMIAQKQMPELAGALSYSAFKDRVLQIDFVNHKVRISEIRTEAMPCPPATCDKFSLITFGKKGPPVMVADGFTINGKKVTAQIDTMYTGTLLIYTASIDKLGLSDAAKTEKIERFPFTDGGVDMKVAPAEKETFHDLPLGVSSPVVYFPTPDVHEPDGMFDATVGLGLFYGTVLTIDFKGSTLSVVKP
jgi:hypothetical protein